MITDNFPIVERKKEFIKAAGNGNIELVKVCLNQGRNVNCSLRDGRTPLHAAVENGHLEVVELLLDRKADIAATDRSGRSVVQIAFVKQHVKILNLLFNRGVPVDSVGPNGETFLQIATTKCDVVEEVVQLLLDRGATIDRDALYRAACNGRVEVVQLLLDQGVEIDAIHGSNGRTALHGAASDGHLEVVRRLLDRGAAIDALNGSNGCTALNFATLKGHLEIVQLLLDRGAAIDAVDGIQGETALHSATTMGHFEVVQLLLDRAVIDTVDRIQGETALHKATFNGRLEIVRLLLDRGAAIEVVNNKGQTALHMSVKHSNAELLRLLLERGAMIVDTANKDGETALHIAACGKNMYELQRRGELAVNERAVAVQHLLDWGAAIDNVNSKGQSALHKAVSVGNYDVAKVLLDRGAAIDTADDDGNTALHISIMRLSVKPLDDRRNVSNTADYRWHHDYPHERYGNRDEYAYRWHHDHGSTGSYAMVKLLLERGAWVDAANKRGQTALHMATAIDSADGDRHFPQLFLFRYENSSHLVKLLLERGASLNSVDSHGRTPLYIAVGYNHYLTTRLLLERGAGISYADVNGITVMEIARCQSISILCQNASGWPRVQNIVHYLHAGGFSSPEWSDRHLHQPMDNLPTQPPSSTVSTAATMVYPPGKKMKLDVLYNRDLCSIITSYILVVRIKGMDEAVLTRAVELLKETYDHL